MKMSRVWAMPNSETFKIKPINILIDSYIKETEIWVDPFVRNSVFKNRCTFTNDLNPEIIATSNMDAEEFLKTLEAKSIDGVLFDPPYSPRQIKEEYDSIGLKVFQKDTQMSFWSKKKDEINRVLKPGGVVITFGWNSMGMGIGRGFDLIEVLLVPHGGARNDTIVTVERKRYVAEDSL